MILNMNKQWLFFVFHPKNEGRGVLEKKKKMVQRKKVYFTILLGIHK